MPLDWWKSLLWHSAQGLAASLAKLVTMPFPVSGVSGDKRVDTVPTRMPAHLKSPAMVPAGCAKKQNVHRGQSKANNWSSL